MRRRAVWLFCMILLTVSAGGCYNDYAEPLLPTFYMPEEAVTQSPAPERAEGGVLTVAVCNPDGWNPLAVWNDDLILYTPMLYDGLVTLDGDMLPRAALASDWSSPDAVNWTVTLRDGVRFHDGSALSAEDVVATVEHIRAAGGVYADCVRGIVSCTGSGRTVQCTLERADGFFPNKLFFPILKASEVNAAEPVGTGAFSYRDTDSDGRRHYVRFTDYYGETPALEELCLVPFATETEKADSDCALIRLGGDGISRYINRDPYNTLYMDRNTLICLVPYLHADPANPQEPILDASVRRALAAAIDRTRVLNAAASGNGVPYDLPLYVGNAYRQTMLSPENSAAVRATLTLLVDATDTELMNVAESVRDQAQDAGMTVTLRTCNTHEAFQEALLHGGYSAAVMRLQFGYQADLYELFAPDGVFNYNGYVPSEPLRELLESVHAAVDWPAALSGEAASRRFAEAVFPKTEEICRMLVHEVPLIGLYVRRDALLLHRQVRGTEQENWKSWNMMLYFRQWYRNS